MKLSKNKFSPRKGFTLVELLIVIAILGILAAGIVVVINPMEKINSANMAKADTFAAGIRNSLAMNLVGEWTFDGNSNDTSGYNNITTTACQSFVADRNGQTSSACSFNGTSDYISVGNSAGLDLGDSDFTIEGWFKRNGSGTENGEIISKHSPSPDRANYEIYWGDFPTNIFGARWTHDNGQWEGFSSNTAAASGTWYHFTFIHSGTKVYFYVNGVQTNSKAHEGTSIDSVTDNMQIGRRDGGSQYFNGVIDDVRIYSKALLSYQIQQLYAQGLVKHLLALK